MELRLEDKLELQATCIVEGKKISMLMSRERFAA